MSTKTKEQISKNMKAVHNKDSKIELMLRKAAAGGDAICNRNSVPE